MTVFYIRDDITRRSIAAYCSEHIGPKRYYLHSSIGGVGWQLKLGSNGWSLTVPNEYAPFIALKYSVTTVDPSDEFINP